MSTDADLIAELEALVSQGDDPEGYYTTVEWCAMLGLAEDSTKRRLTIAKRAGRLDMQKVQRENLAGHIVRVPAYRLLPAA